MKISLGGFGLVKDIDNIVSSGFDFAELDMPELAEMEDAQFECLVEKCLTEKIPVYVGARILPIKEPLIFTDSFKMQEWKDYIEKSCKRSAKLGMRKFVFGNGKARSYIDETSASKKRVLVDFMRMMAEIGGDNGMELLLEPLGPKYSNILNTVEDSAEFCDAVNMSNFKLMADIRHMVGSGESFSNIEKYIKYIRHIHLDYPLSYPERKVPSLEDDYDYGLFFDALKAVNYEGTLTVESDIPSNWQCAASSVLRLLKAYGISTGLDMNH